MTDNTEEFNNLSEQEKMDIFIYNLNTNSDFMNFMLKRFNDKIINMSNKEKNAIKDKTDIFIKNYDSINSTN